MLEAGRVGGVAGDGNIYLFHLHNRYAFLYVVAAEASNLRLISIGESNLANYGQLAGEVVIFGFHIGKAVDSGNDVSCILAQTIEDDAQRGFSCFIGGSCDTDCTLSSCKGFVTCQEAETVGLFPQQHCAQVTMSQTYLAVFCNRSRHAECLESDTDCLCCLCCLGDTLFQSDSSAQGVCPYCVFKSDWLYAFDDGLHVDSFGETQVSGFFQRGHSIFLQSCLNFRHSSFLSFKFRHDSFPPVPYSSRGSIYLAAFS